MRSDRLCIEFWACLILSFVAHPVWMRAMFLIFALILLTMDYWPWQRDDREGFWSKVWNR